MTNSRLILSILIFIPVVIFGQEEEYYLFKYQKDGKEITDTIFKDQDYETFKEMDNLEKLAAGDLSVLPKNDSIFNKKNQLIKLIFEKGGNVFKQTHEVYEYDASGNLTKQIAYDKDDNVKSGYSDIAIYEYDYDAHGNRIEQRYLDETGKPVRIEYIGPAIILMKYDSENRIIEESFLDEKRQPINGFCKVVYEYFDNGKVAKETKYDHIGKIIK